MRRVFGISRAARLPGRSIFFGTLDNASLEVVYRSMLRQSHVRRFIANSVGAYFLPGPHDPNYPHDNPMEDLRSWAGSKRAVGLCLPAGLSDPHRLLRLYGTVAHPVVANGKPEIYHPPIPGDDHGDGHHGGGGWLEQRAARKKHAWQDGVLARGEAYPESAAPWLAPPEQPVFWCEQYKVVIPHDTAPLAVFLARELLRTLGREPTPEAADAAVEELYSGVDGALLDEWRGAQQGAANELFFFVPPLSYQHVAEMQSYQNPTAVYGGPFGSQAKIFDIGGDATWQTDAERFDPRHVFVRDALPEAVRAYPPSVEAARAAMAGCPP